MKANSIQVEKFTNIIGKIKNKGLKVMVCDIYVYFEFMKNIFIYICFVSIIRNKLSNIDVAYTYSLT